MDMSPSTPAAPAVAQPCFAARRHAVWLQVLSVAMALQQGRIDSDGFTRLLIDAPAVLGEDDDLVANLRALSRHWTHLRMTPEARRPTGEALQRAVMRATWPVSSGRADLDG